MARYLDALSQEKRGHARLVLILSPERSGSTLLSVLLGSHSAIVAPPELHLLRFPDFESWRRGYPMALASLVSLAEMVSVPKGPASVEARFAGRTVESIYEELLRLVGPGRFLVDKSPGNAHAVENLQRAERFRPLYIWLVRHPLGVALSRMERHRQKRDAMRMPLDQIKLPLYLVRSWWRRRSGRELQETLERWIAMHQRIESFLARVGEIRYRVVHYEDLVRSPESEVGSLCDFLGVTMEPSMLDPAHNLPSGLQWGLGDEKIRTRSRIDPTSADRWRHHFDESLMSDQAARLWGRLRSVKIQPECESS